MTDTMTPLEYIENLKREMPVQPMSLANVPVWKRRMFVNSMGDPNSLLDKMKELDYAEELVKLLMTRMSKKLRLPFDSGVVTIGTIADNSPGIYVKKVGKRGYAIVFKTGLRDFIYRIARIISTQDLGFDLCGSPDKMLNSHEAARLLAEVYWWYQETGEVHGVEYEINEKQMHFATALAVEAELFFIAHEIGHIVIDVNTTDIFPPLSVGKSASTEHIEEHGADIYALCTTMGFHADPPDTNIYSKQFVYAGAELGLLIYKGLEVLGIDLSGTHPPANLRLNCLRQEMQKGCQENNAWGYLSYLSQKIDETFLQLIEIIQAPSEHDKYFEAQAQETVQKLDELFKTHLSGLDEKFKSGFKSFDEIPDFDALSDGLNSIFSKGYPHCVLEYVEKFIRKMTIENGLVDGKFASTNNWENQAKYFHLIRAAAKAGEPVLTLFSRAMDPRP